MTAFHLQSNENESSRHSLVLFNLITGFQNVPGYLHFPFQTGCHHYGCHPSVHLSLGRPTWSQTICSLMPSLHLTSSYSVNYNPSLIVNRARSLSDLKCLFAVTSTSLQFFTSSAGLLESIRNTQYNCTTFKGSSWRWRAAWAEHGVVED